MTAAAPPLLLVLCLAGTGLTAHVLADDAAAPPAAGATSDQDLAEQVQAALRSDKYFNGKHVTASVEKGNVVLRGFVFSDWDLRDALRIAKQAAGGRKVINNMTINAAERR